jgi:hypothetical protein
MPKRTLTIADVVEALYPIYLWEHRDPKVAEIEVAEALAVLQRPPAPKRAARRPAARAQAPAEASDVPKVIESSPPATLH